MKYIHTGNHLLDIGCGDAAFLKLVHSHIPNTVVEGLEFNELAIKKAALNGIRVTAESIEAFSISNKEKFDVVTAYQVLEHVTDVKSFLQAAIHCIKLDGKLIIGVPNNHPYPYKTDKLQPLNLPPHHMGLWSRESLTAIASLFGLHLVDCKTEPLQNTYYYTDFYLKKHGLMRSKKLLFPLLQRYFKYTKYLRSGAGILAVYKKR